MKIEIISVGKIKEGYLLDGIAEYKKRMGKYATMVETTLPDEPNKDEGLNDSVKRIEGERILKAINPKAYVIALDLHGEMISSEGFARKLDEVSSICNGHLVFVIGGSLGLSEDVLKRANYKLCFSKMTFPHKLFKMMLMEQIYRAYKINNNETYHK